MGILSTTKETLNDNILTDYIKKDAKSRTILKRLLNYNPSVVSDQYLGIFQISNQTLTVDSLYQDKIILNEDSSPKLISSKIKNIRAESAQVLYRPYFHQTTHMLKFDKIIGHCVNISGLKPGYINEIEGYLVEFSLPGKIKSKVTAHQINIVSSFIPNLSCADFKCDLLELNISQINRTIYPNLFTMVKLYEKNNSGEGCTDGNFNLKEELRLQSDIQTIQFIISNSNDIKVRFSKIQHTPTSPKTDDGYFIDFDDFRSFV